MWTKGLLDHPSELTPEIFCLKGHSLGRIHVTSVSYVCLFKGIRKPDSMTAVMARDVMLSCRHQDRRKETLDDCKVVTRRQYVTTLASCAGRIKTTDKLKDSVT